MSGNLMPEEITPAEEKWAKGFVSKMADVLAAGGVDETPEEFKKEKEAIEKIALEKGSKVYEYAHKWRSRLLEALRETI